MVVRTVQLEPVYEYEGSLVSLNDTLLVSDFIGPQSGALDYDDQDGEKDWDNGESATFNGLSATPIGTGTVTVGVDLLGFEINLSSAEPINVFSSDGSVFFHYPEGDPASLLDELATQILNTPGLNTALALLGITTVAEVVAFIEDDVLLDFDIVGLAPITMLCFGRGTLIDTASGARPIESLRIGDLVSTLDKGLRPVQWIGYRRVPAAGRFAPVLIEAGALGNRRALEVSPQHRMLIRSWQAELLFGEHEVLVAACHLVNGTTIRRRHGGTADYYHLLFDSHEIVMSEGIPSESFHPGLNSLADMKSEARKELFSLFPDLMDESIVARLPAARPSLRSYEAAVIRA